jgi:signal transduction histidine kinase
VLGQMLTSVTSVHTLDVVYLPGILLIAFVWGLGLGLVTAVVSTIAFDLFLTPPAWTVLMAKGEFLTVLASSIAVALLTGLLAKQLQARAVEAGAREEAELTAETLRTSRDEQAALRRLATLVASGARPVVVFDAIAREMGHLLQAQHTVVVRYGPEGSATGVGAWNFDDLMPDPYARWPIEPGTVMELVFRTGAPARLDDYQPAGELATVLRKHGVISGVGAPITVGQSLWGAAIAASRTFKSFPRGTEEHLLGFTELAAVAIANTQKDADLKASRARVVAAADEARRRIERDLHDGTQQRLVSIGLEVRAIEAEVPPGLDGLKAQLSGIVRELQGAIAELQEISRGLHPAILAKGGLPSALKSLARRSAVAVELNITAKRRLPEHVEVGIYYLISEALLNAAKHAHATVVRIDLTAGHEGVRVSVRDDGIGGADPKLGSGLNGLIDRIETLNGTLTVTSPAGEGTSLLAEIPTTFEL